MLARNSPLGSAAVSPGVGYSVEFSALLFLLDMFVLSLPSDATHLLFCPLHFLAQ